MSQAVIASLHHGIIVSVQASQGEPLNDPEHILALAQSAHMGGCVGFRLANPENIRFVKDRVPEVPVIGITKPPHIPVDADNHVFITPTLWAAESVAQAGAEIVAMDATLRPRPEGESLAEVVGAMRDRFPETLLMADIATLEDALAAQDVGFDLIGTTLSGYTAQTVDKRAVEAPDFELLSAVCQAVSVPVILEGRVWEPGHVAQGFECGAWAVVIGSAVTRPQLITKRFVQAAPKPRVVS